MHADVFSMSLFVLTCMLLCALMGVTACDCTLENYILRIEKHGCTQCAVINTTICSGYCYTQDTNMKGRLGKRFLIQRVCMPQSLVYRAACVPGCPPDVNPVVYYPEARRCHCSRCDRRTHRCVRKSQTSADHCPETPRRLKMKGSG